MVDLTTEAQSSQSGFVNSVVYLAKAYIFDVFELSRVFAIEYGISTK